MPDSTYETLATFSASVSSLVADMKSGGFKLTFHIPEGYSEQALQLVRSRDVEVRVRIDMPVMDQTRLQELIEGVEEITGGALDI